jgi:adhesin transport system outer membrane protein
VKALQADVETAKAQIKLDQSAFHPQSYMEAGPTYNWQVQGSKTYEWGTGIMLRASWNLFNGFYDYYNVLGNTARMRQSREQLNSQANNLAQESSATWSSLLSAHEQNKFFQVAVINSTATRDEDVRNFV